MDEILTLEETVRLLLEEKIEFVDFLSGPPQIRLFEHNTCHYYRLNLDRRPLVYEHYASHYVGEMNEKTGKNKSGYEIIE